jgi:hypothetical protein
MFFNAEGAEGEFYERGWIVIPAKGAEGVDGVWWNLDRDGS